MGSPTTRIQVIFHDQDAEIVKKLAHEDDVSLSRYINTVVLNHIESDEIQKKLRLIRIKEASVKDAVLSAIEGADLDNDKVALLIQALRKLDPDSDHSEDG